MSDRPELDQLERVVSQILERHVALMRDELVRSVGLPSGAAVAAAPGESSSGQLLKAISAIQAGSTQREILRALLDNMVRYSGRAALFVIKGGAGTGWQGRGFSKNDEVKDFALDVNSGIASRSLQGRMVFSGTVADMDANFIARFGGPQADRVLMLPLLLKDKVAALVYADAGVEPGGRIEEEAVELLVLSTSAWLEVSALRKQAQKDGGAAAAPAEKAEAPAAASPSASDPFAAHAPKHTGTDPFAAQAPKQGGEPSAEAAAEQNNELDTSAATPEPPPAPSTAEPHAPSAEDAEVHQKAQRFARLLVDEIKLYNQDKVAAGRTSKDLYDRLKEDIDKSRATYEKRFGGTAAASVDYFSKEIVRSLAENDETVMGNNFRSIGT